VYIDDPEWMCVHAAHCKMSKCALVETHVPRLVKWMSVCVCVHLSNGSHFIHFPSLSLTHPRSNYVQTPIQTHTHTYTHTHTRSFERTISLAYALHTSLWHILSDEAEVDTRVGLGECVCVSV
jgi:hypothetical protein